MNQAEFVRSVEREYFIVRRICDVLSPDDLAFRPSENQRSIEELLRYLSWCGYESVHQILAGENYEESQFKKTADEFLIEEFPARIGEQADLIRQAIEQLLGEDWQDRKAQYWWGQEGSLPAVLVDQPSEQDAKSFLATVGNGRESLGVDPELLVLRSDAERATGLAPGSDVLDELATVGYRVGRVILVSAH